MGNGTEQRTWSMWLAVPAAWCLAGVAVVPFDVRLSEVLLDNRLPGDLRALFARAEIFGHGYGLLAIAITIYLLDPARRRHLIRLVLAFVTAGLVADVIKLQVSRVRPRYLDATLGDSTFLGTIWQQWPAQGERWFEDSRASFPSAHTACAMALAYGLSRLYPAARGWFYLLALLCAMNRIDGGAHYASDVCCGAALGYFVAHALRCSKPLDRWEEASSDTRVSLVKLVAPWLQRRRHVTG